MTDDSLLYFAFTKIEDGELVDKSGNGRNATLEGDKNAEIVPDVGLGRALKVAGATWATLPPDAFPTGSEITVMFWTRNPQPGNAVVLAFSDRLRMLACHVPWADGVVYFHCGNDGNDYDYVQATIEDVNLAQWHHWAFTKNVTTGEMRIYLDGGLRTHETGKHGPLATPTDFSLAGVMEGAPYDGDLAHFRIYDRALTPSQVRISHLRDRLVHLPSATLQPLQLDVFNHNQQPVLDILDKPDGNALFFELTNIAPNPIALAASTVADEHNYTLALIFRPGTLEETTEHDVRLDQGTLTEGWQMSAPYTRGDGTVLYYLTQANGVQMEPRTTGRIGVERLTASAVGGARSTRVLVNYRYAEADGKAQAPTLLGERIAHLTILSERGFQRLPLHAGFFGSNTVLNTLPSGGASVASDLRLRVTNVMHDQDIRVNGVGSEAPTHLILRFEAPVTDGVELEEWMLASVNEINNIGISGPPGWTVSDARTTEGRVTEWTCTPDEDGVLQAHEALDFYITNIVTTAPSGTTFLHLQYRNVPGYWDGQFSVPIEKTPVVIRKKNVGISEMPRDDAALNVRALAGMNYAIYANNDSAIAIEATNNSTNYAAIYAENATGVAIEAKSVNGIAIEAISANSIGLYATTGDNIAIEATNDSANNAAIYARNANGTGIELISTNGIGLYTTTGDSIAIEALNNADGQPTLRLANNGKDVAMWATNNSDKSPTLYLNNNGTGGCLRLSGHGDSFPVINIDGAGDGTAVAARSADGNAVYATNNATNHPTIWAQNAGANNAIYATNNAATHPTIYAENTGGQRAFYAKCDSGYSTIWAENTNGQAIGGKVGDHNAINVTNNSGKWPTLYLKNEGGGPTLGQDSSIEKKTNVRPIANALALVMKLEGVRFNWKQSGIEDVGFIAEHTAEHLPQAVCDTPDGPNTGMNYMQVVPVLLQAVKEQQALIERLTQDVAQLEARLASV